MKKIICTLRPEIVAAGLSVVTLGLFLPHAATAQACPGMTYGVVGANAYQASLPSMTTMPGPLYVFLSPGGCSAIPFGTPAPMSCFVSKFMFGAFYTASVAANFFNATDAMNTAAGCSFECGGQTCIVRGGDALPVELMEFSVEEKDDADADAWSSGQHLYEGSSERTRSHS